MMLPRGRCGGFMLERLLTQLSKLVVHHLSAYALIVSARNAVSLFAIVADIAARSPAACDGGR
ncbi:MAG: hypothetical protein AB7O56_02635 [Bauldia sp.]